MQKHSMDFIKNNREGQHKRRMEYSKRSVDKLNRISSSNVSFDSCESSIFHPNPSQNSSMSLDSQEFENFDVPKAKRDLKAPLAVLSEKKDFLESSYFAEEEKHKPSKTLILLEEQDENGELLQLNTENLRNYLATELKSEKELSTLKPQNKTILPAQPQTSEKSNFIFAQKISENALIAQNSNRKAPQFIGLSGQTKSLEFFTVKKTQLQAQNNPAKTEVNYLTQVFLLSSCPMHNFPPTSSHVEDLISLGLRAGSAAFKHVLPNSPPQIFNMFSCQKCGKAADTVCSFCEMFVLCEECVKSHLASCEFYKRN